MLSPDCSALGHSRFVAFGHQTGNTKPVKLKLRPKQTAL